MANKKDAATGLPLIGVKEVRQIDLRSVSPEDIERMTADHQTFVPTEGSADAVLIPRRPKAEIPSGDLVEKTRALLDVLPEPDEVLEPTPGRETLFFLDEVFNMTPAVDAALDKAADHVREVEDERILAEVVAGAKIKSDGGKTGYYDLPEDATELNDLIEHKRMGFALGNIFKACYRLGEKDGTDLLYDLKKIVYFAEKRLIPYVKKHGRLP